MTRLVLFGAVLVLLPLQAHAHPLSPSSLELTESRDGTIAMRYRTPSARPVGTSVAPVIPRGCEATEAPVAHAHEATHEAVATLRCEGGLVGKTFVFRGLRDAPTDVLWQVTLRDGTFAQGLLHGENDRFVVPRHTRPRDVITEYLALGVTHLVTGFDHVLFVLALLFVLDRRRALVIAISAFTVGHSVSLALSALDIVRLPEAPVEIAIALSLLYMALAMLRRDGMPEDTTRDARTALVSAAFGLVHGLGFAGVLAEAGLPTAAVPEALFGFNVGIELAQLGLVATALCVAYAVRRLPIGRPIPYRLVAAYVVGSLSAMWIIERSITLFV